MKITTVSRLKYLFLGVCERSYVIYLYFLVFTNVLPSRTFISWWLRTFYAKPFSLLMGTKFSRRLPLFLECFGHFTLNTFLSWRLQTFPTKTLALLKVTNFILSKSPPDSTNGVFLPNPIIPLLFTSLLLTYKVATYKQCTISKGGYNQGTFTHHAICLHHTKHGKNKQTNIFSENHNDPTGGSKYS